MQVQRVVTNESCNQNCWFCNARRPVERPEFIARAALIRRIDDALSQNCRELVLTGGEPTLRNDIAAVVQRASGGGARVILETNAALIDRNRAEALASSGLGIARVQLLAWGTAADAVSRDPGGFEAAVAGIYALASAGVKVEVTVPIVRRNSALVADLVRAIGQNKLPVAAVVLLAPFQAPDPDECATVEETTATIVAASDAGRRVGVPVRLDPATFLPPCLFDKPERIAHLYALNRGNAERSGYRHVEACSECLVRDRCPGLPTEHARPMPSARAIKDDRLRRRLTVMSSVEEQIAREFLGRDELRHSAYGPITEYTVRVNFHCNQACEFCFVSTHLPPAAETTVREAIGNAGREGAVVVLSGGEPTLNPRLVEYVQLAKTEGARAVELQTNATRLGDPQLVRALVDAGLDQAMISLHGSTAAISDSITGAPGTFVQTVAGIDQMAATGIRVRLNFVFCQDNWRDFPAFVDLVQRRWPTAAIVFSFVGSHTDVVPRKTALIPSFSDIMPSLLAGLDHARAAGIEVHGFDSMCGLPLCLVPESERSDFSSVELPPAAGAGEFVKAEICTTCSQQRRCFGVRRGYAELYGTGELRPI